jgi:Barrel-sandwich domain of CusB or HlyD membrane-fusion
MLQARWLKSATLVLAGVATGSGVNLPAQNKAPAGASRPGANGKLSAADDVPVHLVKPGKLSVTVTERGTIEASRSQFATCQVEGTATILWVLPDGSLVTKGQLICELDSTPFREKLAEASLSEKSADANHQNARLTREVAEIALREHTEAKQVNDQTTLKELKAQVEKCRSDELAKRALWELENVKLRKLGTQIARCQIFARADGLLEHANDKRRLNFPPNIINGATVRERQIIAKILDIAGPMEVNTKVPASVVKQVKRGLKARINVDLLPAEDLTGVVRSVAPLADPVFFDEPREIRYHTARVEIEKARAGLRLGMAAQVEVVVAELDDVLSVPVESVVRSAGKDQVAVKKSDGAFAWRDVTLGQSNQRFVEVKEGVKSGELVAIQPRAPLSEKR